MAETTQHIFSFKELLGLMVKDKGIHQGHWALHVKFGLTAVNVKGGMNTSDPLLPTAIIPLIEIGIQEIKEPHELSVDASRINPSPRRKKKGSK